MEAESLSLSFQTEPTVQQRAQLGRLRIPTSLLPPAITGRHGFPSRHTACFLANLLALALDLQSFLSSSLRFFRVSILFFVSSESVGAADGAGVGDQVGAGDGAGQ